jgi:hypothetical protein
MAEFKINAGSVIIAPIILLVTMISFLTVPKALCAPAEEEIFTAEKAPHRRDWSKLALPSQRSVRSLKVDFNDGEIKGEITWNVHAVRVLDRTKSQPEMVTYYPGNEYIARVGKKIAPIGMVTITKFRAQCFQAAAFPPGPKWKQYDDYINFMGIKNRLYTSGVQAQEMLLIYGDPGTIENSPYFYYSIHIMTLRGTTEEKFGYLQDS